MLQQQKYSNEWVLNGIDKNHTTAQVIERFNFAQGIVLKEEEAKNILSDYTSLSDDGIYNARKLPYRKVALIQQSYTSVGWSGMDHSADFVELTMLGPGSDLLSPFIKNTDLHRMMLDATGMA
jgi:alkaline phosphatase